MINGTAELTPKQELDKMTYSDTDGYYSITYTDKTPVHINLRLQIIIVNGMVTMLSLWRMETAVQLVNLMKSIKIFQ